MFPIFELLLKMVADLKSNPLKIKYADTEITTKAIKTNRLFMNK